MSNWICCPGIIKIRWYGQILRPHHNPYAGPRLRCPPLALSTLMPDSWASSARGRENVAVKNMIGAARKRCFSDATRIQLEAHPAQHLD